MIVRKNILTIGRDSTAATEGSQLYKRIQMYAEYHDFTFVVMNKGEVKSISIGDTRVVLTGGKTLLTSFFKALFFSWKEMKKNTYDAVSTQDVLYAGLVGYIVSRLFKKPLFVQVHGDYLGNPRWFSSKIGYFNRLMNGVGTYILLRAEYIRVVSERLRADLFSKYPVKKERVVSIPIGTDVRLFHSGNNEPREKVLFFAQRLIPEKCPMLFAEVAVAALQKYPEVSVKIAGSGSMEEEMRNYFAQAGVLERVTFCGAVPQDVLATLYLTAYVYIHTADWEGWGMPMIEAMAAGCPVVTTNTGCAGEAIRHEETGLVTAINDKVALIASVERLLTDESFWKMISQNGIVEAREWSFETLTRKNMEWYATESKH
jgi:glycosyltransferase involved in cell wall biosynthesis